MVRSTRSASRSAALRGDRWPRCASLACADAIGHYASPHFRSLDPLTCGLRTLRLRPLLMTQRAPLPPPTPAVQSTLLAPRLQHSWTLPNLQSVAASHMATGCWRVATDRNPECGGRWYSGRWVDRRWVDERTAVGNVSDLLAGWHHNSSTAQITSAPFPNSSLSKLVRRPFPCSTPVLTDERLRVEKGKQQCSVAISTSAMRDER